MLYPLWLLFAPPITILVGVNTDVQPVTATTQALSIIADTTLTGVIALIQDNEVTAVV